MGWLYFNTIYNYYSKLLKFTFLRNEFTHC